ncbi:MAG TPA: hypothetical protein ENK06_03655 [Gammaproteobacteria bacterium]|nr:hypothetical protein [Gammaproteobacteria bacterium]
MSESITDLTDAPPPYKTKPRIKVSARRLLRDHGPGGWLIIRLQRYAMLGWVLFFLLATVFSFYVIASAMRPVPVIAVNQDGQVLGAFDYLNADSRSDVEILAGAKHWLRYYYSLNSRTIFEDYTAALNMMDTSLRESKLKEILDLNYLQNIEHASARSHLAFDQVTLVDRRNRESVVALSGNIVIDNGKGLVEKAFSVQLTLETVSRATLGQLGTLGLRVLSVVEQ